MDLFSWLVLKITTFSKKKAVVPVIGAMSSALNTTTTTVAPTITMNTATKPPVTTPPPVSTPPPVTSDPTTLPPTNIIVPAPSIAVVNGTSSGAGLSVNMSLAWYGSPSVPPGHFEVQAGVDSAFSPAKGQLGNIEVIPKSGMNSFNVTIPGWVTPGKYYFRARYVDVVPSKWTSPWPCVIFAAQPAMVSPVTEAPPPTTSTEPPQLPA